MALNPGATRDGSKASTIGGETASATAKGPSPSRSSMVLSTLGVRKVSAPFSHGALHEVQEGVLLADSYHCSRYNVNTGVLTESMFHEVVAKVAKAVG